MEELKPCPFCGSTAIYQCMDYGYINDSVVIFCNSCKTIVKIEANHENGWSEEALHRATEAWNRRANDE